MARTVEFFEANRLGRSCLAHVQLEDRQVHFIHVKSTKEDAIPIILLHGYALRVCSTPHGF